MSSSKQDEPEITFLKRSPKMTPPGYSIRLTVAQGLEIAKFLESPAYKVLKNIIIAQRKDHIARQALSMSTDNEQLNYYKGEAAELQLLPKTLERLAEAAKKADNEEADVTAGEDKDF